MKPKKRPSAFKRLLRFQNLERRELMANDYMNSLDSFDVDQDGTHSPLDALAIIDDINLRGSRPLVGERLPGAPFVDVDGDKSLSPLDALSVINAINRGRLQGLSRVLQETGRFATDEFIRIGTGQASGTRTYQLKIESRLLPSSSSAIGDLFAVYIVDGTNPTQILLNRGITSSPIFTLTPQSVETTPGLTTFDGQFLSIDLSSITKDSALLKLQLLNHDPTKASSITATPIANEVDSEGVQTTQRNFLRSLVEVGPTTNVSSLIPALNAIVDGSEVQWTSANRYEADLTLVNKGTAIGRDTVVLLNGLPVGVTVENASGLTPAGIPYLNFRNAIESGGLGRNERSNSIRLMINNPNNVPFSITPEVLTGTTNRTPTLPPIANLTVMPGGKLSVKLAGQDPDGDTIRYSIKSNSVMPTARLTGDELLFSPTPTEIGNYQFEVTASDGALSVSQSVNLSVITDSNTTTRLSGKILDVSGAPISGLRVEVGSQQALTQSDGSFQLNFGNSLPTGDTLRVRAELLPSSRYPFIAEKLALLLEHDVYRGFNNQILRPVYLPVLNSGTAINPALNQTVTQQLVPNEAAAAVAVRAGTLFTQQGTPFTGSLSITEVRVDRTPASLPTGLIPDLVVTIQPGEMSFATPAQLTLPNRAGYAPGKLMDLWSINPTTGEFENVGSMRVSVDGSKIETISGGVRNSSWHFTAPPPTPPQNAPQNPEDGCGSGNSPKNPEEDGCGKKSAPAGSVVELHSGALHEWHNLVSYESLGETRQLLLHYKSDRANPVNNVFVSVNGITTTANDRLVASVEFTRGDGFSFNAIAGTEGSKDFYWRLDQLDSVLASIQQDFSNYPSGVYSASISSGIMRRFTQERAVGTRSQNTVQLVVVNGIGGKFGNGWSLSEMSQVIVNPDGKLLLVSGDGTQLVFEANSSDAYDSPPGDFTTMRRTPVGFERKFKDGTLHTFGSDGYLRSHSDRNGNVTIYEYAGVGELTRIVDPVGLATRFEYSEGNVSKIIDPAGRITRLDYDALGNLIRVQDPDQSQRNWDYDSKHLMTSEVDKRGFSESIEYNSYSQVKKTTIGDGTSRYFEAAQSRGIVNLAMAGNELTAPHAVSNAGAFAQYTDSSGRNHIEQLDRLGQSIESADSIGPKRSTIRDTQNRVTQQKDGRGNPTRYSYDTKGNVLRIEEDLGQADQLENPTMTWTGTVSGLWSNPANWSGNRLPRETDSILIAPSASTSIQIDVPNVTLARLYTTAFVELNLGSSDVFLLGRSRISGELKIAAFGLLSAVGSSAVVNITASVNAESGTISAVQNAAVNITTNTFLQSAKLIATEGGTISLPSLTNAFKCDFEVSGTSKINTVRLTRIDECTFSISNGAVLSLPLVEQFASEFRPFFGTTAISVRGQGSRMELPNLTQLTSGGFFDVPIAVNVSEGGVLSLQRLATVESIGLFRFLATGAGSRIELPVATNYKRVVLASVNGGVVSAPLINTIVEGGVTISNSPAAYPLLSKIDGSEIAVSKGSTVDLSRIPSSLVRARFRVTEGSQLSVPVSDFASEFVTSVTVDGIGSRLDFPNLVGLSGGDASYRTSSLVVSGGGQLTMPLLRGLTSNTWFSITSQGQGSRIDFPVATNLKQSFLSNIDGGRIVSPELISILEGGLVVSGSTATYPRLSNINGAEIAVSKGSTIDLSRTPASLLRSRFRVTEGSQLTVPASSFTSEWAEPITVDGAGSRLDFPNLTNLTGGDASFRTSKITVSGGGQLTIPLLTELTSNTWFTIVSQGQGSKIDFPIVTSFKQSFLSNVDSGKIIAPSLVAITEGGLVNSNSTVSYPLLSNITGSEIAVGKGSTVDLSQTPASLVRTRFRVTEGSQLNVPASSFTSERADAITVDGVGSRLDFPNLTNLTGGDASFRTSKISISGGGQIAMPVLKDLASNTWFTIVSQGQGSKIDLPIVTSFKQSFLSNVDGGKIIAPSLVAITEGGLVNSNSTVSYPLLSNITGSEIAVSKGSTVDLSQTPASLVRARFRVTEGSQLTVPASSFTSEWADAITVDGAGSRLDFPNLTVLTGGDASFRRASLRVSAGGTLNLPALQSATDGFVTLTVQGATSKANLEQARNLQSFTLVIRSDASVNMPLLTSVASIDSDGMFTLPVSNSLSVNESFTQKSTGRLIMTVPASLNQALVRVVGAVSLSGILEVKFSSAPVVDSTFDAFSYSSVAGAFSSIVTPGAPSGIVLEPNYTSNKLGLTVRQGSGEGPDIAFSIQRASSDTFLPRFGTGSMNDLASGEGEEAQTLVREFIYDALYSQLTKSVDENGHITLFEVDPANGNRLSLREVVGTIDTPANGEIDDVVTRYTYTLRGQMDLMTDPLGRITDYDYDQFGRLVTVTRAKGTADEATTRFEYDLAGNRTAVIDPNGNRTEYLYDAMNRLIKTIEADPDGVGSQSSPVSLFEYDPDGNLTKTTDALQHTSTNRYDARSRMIESTGPDPDGVGPLPSPVTKMTYDTAGNVTSVVDPLSNTTQFRYDTRNRRIESTDPDGGKTAFAYDFDDNLVKLTDSVGNVTQFAFDARDRQTQETDPLGKSIRYAYDGADSLIEKTDRNGRVTQFTFDDRDRLARETWVGGGNTINYVYDKADNLLSINDSFSSLTYTYDALDRVKSVDNQGTPNFPRVVAAYAYDDVGNVTSMTDTINGQTGATTNYSFNALNRLVEQSQVGTSTQTKRVGFGFNSLGQYTEIKRFNALTENNIVASTAFTYDGQNRLSLIDHRGSSDQVYESFGYRYDAGSRITRITEKNQAIDYGYDDRDQLVLANYGDAARTDEAFKFDANGNRVESNAHGTAYRTATGNRLTTDGVYNYAYDNEGNLTKRTEIATGSTREFQWDHRNRLTMLSDKNASGVAQQVVRYSYDSLGRRISKQVDTTPLDTVDAAIEQYVYDGEDVILDFVDPDGSGPAASQQTTRYLRGPGIDNLLAIESASGTNWVLQDHLGSNRALVSSAGVLVQSIDYDSFGKPIVGLPLTRYLYTGRELDAESGLFYYRARYYDSSIGRFTNEDPIGFAGGSWNTQIYVDNSPVSAVDPLGLALQIPVGFGVGIGVAVEIASLLRAGWTLSQILELLRELNEASDAEEAERCRQAKSRCIEQCSDDTLPTCTNDGAPFYRCVQRCMGDSGCQ